MKHITILVTLLLLMFTAKAQGVDDDTKSGKYFKNPFVKRFTGKWTSNNRELELVITTKKTRHNYKEDDYYYDPIYVKVTKCIYKEDDVAKKLKEPFMFLGNATSYGSVLLKDPITGDDIIIKLYYIDKNTLKLNVNTRYAPGTSTIFPLGDTILRRKIK
ncbi:hypothetical protein DU508_18410 [Pedobacter chinensis]|uniref:DUF6705 domain-containing protein n=1 Tax=Pedobacter chinensis TaxID=2282421 RepID=A0A369PRF9_9SPHI|nr:DUF6705 family protein [Pedobacter chinensis]RDC55124.1 hypothetical protein DU508_18410 [Pedobacter chinensis]